MIYNSKNRNKDTTECQKEKKTFNAHAVDCPMYSKQTNLKRSLKSLVMSKCVSTTCSII